MNKRTQKERGAGEDKNENREGILLECEEWWKGAEVRPYHDDSNLNCARQGLLRWKSGR